MKKILIAFVFIASTTTGFAQSIFDKFEDNDEVTTVVINQKLFEMLGSIGEEVDGDEAKELSDIANNLKELKIFTTTDTKVSTEMLTTMKKYIARENLSELMRVKDKGQTVKVYVREGKSENFVKELIMFVYNKEDGQTVLMSLTGNIDLRKVGKIADKVRGAEALKDIKTKK